MPNVSVSDQTFKRLAEQAATQNMSVEEYAQLALDRIASDGTLPLPAPLPLTGEAWKQELEAWKKSAESRASRYPSDHTLDDSREAIYGERDNAQ